MLQQVHRQALADAPIEFSVPDPFASRRASLPAADAGRFEMQRGITPAMVLVQIGKLIGGPDYMADACPRHQRNLDNLLAAGDSPALQMELEYLQRHCWP